MRTAEIARKTNETEITVSVNLDGTGKHDMATGIGFLDHMLDQLSKHSLIDMTVRAKGDLHIDFHHTAEDVGIALGEAVKKALGDKRGIRRYASSDLPMDGTLTRVALDVSGRPFLVWKVEFTRDKVGEMDTELFPRVVPGLRHERGDHSPTSKPSTATTITTSPKAPSRRWRGALRDAVEIDPRASNVIPSTKGTL
jgi:imidazoleglycerol-phosphate dehydratase